VPATRLRGVLCGGLMGVVVMPASAVADSARQPKFLTKEVKFSIEKGLYWLSKQQAPDGRIMDQTSKTRKYPVTETATSVMAFMANGTQVGRGRYGKVVERALNYLVDHARNAEVGIFRSGDHADFLYEHYFAVTVVAEAWGEWKRRGLEDVLEKAAKVMNDAQLKGGGFPYGKAVVRPTDQICSATGILALRALRDGGIPIPERMAREAVGYLKRQALANGSFAYGNLGSWQEVRNPEVPASVGKGIEAVVRTAVGVLALWSMGESEAPEVKRGVAYLVKNSGLHPTWPLYGAYYQARAMYQVGGKTWEAWYPKFQKALLHYQKPEGYFFSPRAKARSRVLSTAFAVTALSVQKGLLPLFQR